MKKMIGTTTSSVIERSFKFGDFYGQVIAEVAIVSEDGSKPIVKTRLDISTLVIEVEQGATVISKIHEAIEWALGEKEKMERQVAAGSSSKDKL